MTIRWDLRDAHLNRLEYAAKHIIRLTTKQALIPIMRISSCDIKTWSESYNRKFRTANISTWTIEIQNLKWSIEMGSSHLKRIAAPSQKGDHVLSLLWGTSRCAIIIFCTSINQHLWHSNGSTREIRIVVQPFPQLQRAIKLIVDEKVDDSRVYHLSI